jgi:hypothetical protein
MAVKACTASLPGNFANQVRSNTALDWRDSFGGRLAFSGLC